jgi:hypothetical protein
MDGWTCGELPGQGIVNEAAVNPRNGYVTEYYREKVFLQPPGPMPAKFVEHTDEGAQFITAGIEPGDTLIVAGEKYTVELYRPSRSYTDTYENKAWTPHPADYHDPVDWYYDCKAESEEPSPREPYKAPRKGRRGWNQPRPHQHRHLHRPRMNYKRRRRHG